MKAGWQIRSLGDLCEFQRGLTYAKGDEVQVSNNVVLRATNIDLQTNSLDFSELKYITDRLTIPESKKVKEGSIIICTASGSKSHLGKVAYIDDNYGYAFGGFMGMITPKNGVSSKFLFHLMTSQYYKDFIRELSDGININNLKYEDLRFFSVPLPPLPEQQRIVAILDDAFDGIAAAKVNAQKNLQNARELFENYLGLIFTNNGKDWVKTTIGERIRFIDYRGHTPTKTESGLRLITAKNVKMGYLQESPMEFVSPEIYDKWMTRGIPQRGDVLFTTEAPLANIAQLDTDEKVVFAQRIIIMQPDSSELNSTFLKYLLLSSPIQQRIHEKGTGATVKGIKAKFLRTVNISFPISLQEQRDIVKQLDILYSETQCLEAIYRKKIAVLDELKQSLLHQAFNGEL